MEADDSLLRSVSPFLIVRDLRVAVDFYCDKLGFQSILEVPKDDPFFAIVCRDSVSFSLKEIGPDTTPVPNHCRHEWARWDAFVDTRNPDELYREFCEKDVTIHEPLADTDDGLRAFEIQDVNGYVICFGCDSNEGHTNRGHADLPRTPPPI